MSAKRIYEVLDVTENNNNNNNLDISNFKVKSNSKSIFSYDNITVINNISFTIKKGEMIALVGKSGSGKSTIADILARFYEVNQGEILIIM